MIKEHNTFGHILLEQDLLNNPKVLTTLQNDQVFLRFYQSLVGYKLTKNGAVATITPKIAESMLMRLRRTLDPSIDHQNTLMLSAQLGVVDSHIKNIFSSLGWEYHSK